MSTPSARTLEEKSQGRRRAWLLLLSGAVFGVVLFGVFGYTLGPAFGVREEMAAIRKLTSVATHMLSSGANPAAPPAPIIVRLDTNLVQVRSIALGHPRLAVINGKQVAEGDTVTVHTPTRAVAITLRVLQISDRRVQLSDGTQVITAHLALPSTK